MNRREFLITVAGALLGGTTWLELRRRRREQEERERKLLALIDEANRDPSGWRLLGEELMLPIRDAVHYERWARPFYGLPPLRSRPTAGELCAERMMERYL